VLIAQLRSRAQILIEEEVPEPGEPPAAALPPPAHTRPKWSKWLLRSMVAAAIAIGCIGLLMLLRRHPTRSRALTETDTVVLADFANSTGDPVFDGTLRQSLRNFRNRIAEATTASMDALKAHSLGLID
jgi:hypothetical protein